MSGDLQTREQMLIRMADERTKCEACGASLPVANAHTDSDGFTGCRPCFPISNLPADSDRFMRGPCHRKSKRGARL